MMISKLKLQTLLALLMLASSLGLQAYDEPSSDIQLPEFAQIPENEGLLSSCSTGCGSQPSSSTSNSAPSSLQAPIHFNAPTPPPVAAPVKPTTHTPHLYQPGKTPPVGATQPLYAKPSCTDSGEGYTINFEDISVIQLIQFISKISGTNFLFNKGDLDGISITIVSEDQTSVSDLSAALLQVLKMNNLSVVEQGKNVLIYKNQNMSKVSTVITDSNLGDSCNTAIVTRVFQLYHVDANKIATIVKGLVSPEASVEASVETRHLIVTDITANVDKIADLLLALDTPSLAVDVAEYQVRNADPKCLADYAREILTPLAAGSTLSITPEGASQTIFIVAAPFIIEKAKGILSSLDVADISCLNPAPVLTELKNNSFFMYKLKYQNGKDIAEALHEIGLNLQSTGVANLDFVNTIFSLQWIEVNNSIVIAGSDDSIQKVVALIDDLDKLPKQVYIEVLIIDTTLSNSLDFGVQWIALGDEQNKLAFASGLLATSPNAGVLEGTNTTNPGARYIAANPTNNPPTIPNPGRDVALPNPSLLQGVVNSASTSAFGLGIIGNVLRHNGQSFLTLGALLSALDEEMDTTVVLNPKIMVEDTQPADFFVGQNIPYQTTSTVVQQTGSVTQNIQYEDIGVQLQITPTISPDNMVTLQINQTVADIVPGGGLTPVTNKTLATTRVHVPDGTFLVMSGHVRDEVDYTRSGIPCLGTLPLIGPAFSRTIEQRIKRNLIFFIRPQVITHAQGGVDFTDKEGYDFNWETDPCSILECGPEEAPECQVYPLPPELQY